MITNDICIIVCKSEADLIYWKAFNKETFYNYIEVFSDLKSLGYYVVGITSDWHKSLVSAVKYVYPSVPHQRCLVHT